uniref:KIB1-4 beta-propeller domain-containing protein n=1 Tax=Triticum urartu TaxID=4572 RepID=A0A8R7UHK0_TRIUA
MAMDSFVWMNATVCVASPSSIAVVIWFLNTPLVICAQPGDKGWKIIHTDIQLSNTLPFDGGLYGVTRVGRQLLQVYPVPDDPHTNAVVAEVPKELGDPESCLYYLMESMGAMHVDVLHRVVRDTFGPVTSTIFRVDLRRRELVRVTSLGDRALFISRDRCLSVLSRDLPSISGNSVYFARPGEDPVEVYPLCDGSFESTVTASQSSDIRNGVLPTSVRPFTLADHLATYCRHREWTRGLMFHEHCYMRPTWSELWKRMTAQDSEVVVSRLRTTERELKKVELPDLLSSVSARTLSQV